MHKWSWWEETSRDDIRSIKVYKKDGGSYLLNDFDDIDYFSANFGRVFIPKIEISEISGKTHNYVYKIKDMKKLRLSYYQRNNIPIPEEDYLVKEIEKWNWFTKGVLSKIAVLYLRYVDGRSCKYRKEGRKYLKYSNPYKTWIPATGYAFFLGAVRDVYIEDFNGRVYMFSYSDSEMKRLQDY